METTINTILKHNALPTAALSVLIYLQVGMGGDIQDVRNDIQALRTEMAEDHQEIRADVSVLGERIARVETRLASVERVLYADFEPPAP